MERVLFSLVNCCLLFYTDLRKNGSFFTQDFNPNTNLSYLVFIVRLSETLIDKRGVWSTSELEQPTLCLKFIIGNSRTKLYMISYIVICNIYNIMYIVVSVPYIRYIIS